MKLPNEPYARRAGLPTAGELVGVITLIQETRFRLEDERGRGYLFTLGWRAGVAIEELYRWSGQRTPVRVRFAGPPDLGGVAVAVRPA